MAQDLDIDVCGGVGPGRRASPVELGSVVELTRSDLAALEVPGHTEPPEIKRLSERHHRLARLIALGSTGTELVIHSGYTASRISILRNSPAFKELIEHYRQNSVDPAYDAVLENMSGLAQDAIMELRDRLEDEELRTKVPVSQLLEIVKTTADRTGRGPTTTTNLNVNADMGSRIEAARRRARESAAIEAEIIPDEKE